MRYFSLVISFLLCTFTTSVFAASNNLSQYFPEPVQSWTTESIEDYKDFPKSNLGFHNASSSIGDGGQSIIGWSEDYINSNLVKGFYGSNTDNEDLNKALLVGFDATSEVGHTHRKAACDIGGGCIVGTDGYEISHLKVPAPPLLDLSFPEDGQYTIDFTPTNGSDNSGYKVCNSSDLCSVSIEQQANGRNLVTMTILQDLNSLTINNNSGKEDFRVVISGSRSIKTLEINTNHYGEVFFKADSVLNVETMKLNNNAILTFDSNVRINIGNLFDISNSGYQINYLNKKNPLFYGPTATFNTRTPAKEDFWGYFIVKNMILNNDINIIGSVTANNINLATPNIHIIKGASFSKSENYTIDVTPSQQFSLMCQTPEIRIEVKNEDGTEIATGYDGNVEVSVDPTDGLTLNQPTTGSLVSEGIYKPDAGVVVIPVESNTLKEYAISATLSTDSTQTDKGDISFVPFSFDVDDQYVIANKAQNVSVKVLACDQGEEVAVNYTGTPTVSSTLEAPKSGIKDLTFAPKFITENEGTLDTSLTFTDSGKLRVTLTDDRFNCTGYEGCPIGEDGEANGILQGSFYVSSRPWTFAICDANGSAMDGNISDPKSLGYKAAGEKFTLNVKPLRWVEGQDGNKSEIEFSNLCDRPITQNFMQSDAPTATIKLAYQLVEPTLQQGGVSGDLNGTLSLKNTEYKGPINQAFYQFDNLSWSEVGVLKITANTEQPYLEKKIKTGYRNIGRFYPDHLTPLLNTWTYSDGQHHFAYMNQPISMKYEVQAQNANNEPTQNYGYFTDALKAKMKLVAIQQETGKDLSSRFSEEAAQDWDGANYNYENKNFVFYKQVKQSSPYVSEVDGPYNKATSQWGLQITDTADNVDFIDGMTSFEFNEKKAVVLENMPDFRYGRMALENVSGPIGEPITVPLRIEYWNGSNFVTNTDDSGSKFKANIYYVMSNHANSGAKLTSTNSANEQSVSAGKSSVLKASQDTPQRETVRLFLRQGNDSDGIGNNATPVEDDELNATNEGWKNAQDIGQPWLQFNWRNKGDEDPSTVVNFGAYRGNDRVIYRGEPEQTVQ